MTTTRSSLLLSSLALVALLGAGCGSTSRTPAMNTLGSGDSQTNTEPTGSIGANIPIPSTFPSDLPRYTGAATVAALHDGGSYTITQQTTDPIDMVVQALDQQLTSKGYRATMHIGSAGEALQITDYTNVEAKAMVRVQVSADASKKKTVALIVRSEANP